MSQTNNYKPLQIKKQSQKALRDTPENKFWRKFETTHQQTYSAVIRSINSGQNSKNLISFTDGRIVDIYDAGRKKMRQQFKNFKNEIKSLCMRKDGNLLATGEENGVIKVFDIKRKSILREYKNHKKAVHAIQFNQQESNLFSGSDDLNLRLFDVAGGTIVRTLPDAHQDFIRSICVLPNSSNTILSSSYDFKIHMYDFNSDSNTPQLVFDHGHPVENIAVIGSGFQFTSVGGTYTTTWDIRTGKVLESQNNNQKTVTCVEYLSSGDRFITAALDGHVKIYRTDTFSVTHQYKFPNPIMAMDFTQDTQHFAVGMSEGSLVVRSSKRKLGDEDLSDEENNQEEEQENDFIKQFLKGTGNQMSEDRLNSYKYFNRGIYDKQENYDLKYDEGRKKKLNTYDKFLKKFQYKECFATAFQHNQADIIVTLYEEFLQRGCLKQSLTNLEEDEQKLIFTFIDKKIVNPKYSDMCIDMLNILTELYQFDAEDLLIQARQALEQEILVQKDLLVLEGSLETIINTNILQ